MPGFKDSAIIRILRGEKNIDGKGVYKSPEDIVMEATGAAPTKEPKGEKPSEEVESYISNGMRLIHSSDTRDNIIGMLKSAKNATNGVAMAAANVFSMLDKSTNNSIPNEVKLQGAAPLIEQLIEVGEAADLFKLNVEQIKEASGKSISLYMKKAFEAGALTVDEIKDAYSTFNKQAEEEGQKGGGDQTGGVLGGGV